MEKGGERGVRSSGSWRVEDAVLLQVLTLSKKILQLLLNFIL